MFQCDLNHELCVAGLMLHKTRVLLKSRQVCCSIGSLYSRQSFLSGFLLSVENTSRLFWFCFTMVCDWLNTKTNRDLLTRVFPRFKPVTYICFEIWFVNCSLLLLWLARVTTWVLRDTLKPLYCVLCDANRYLEYSAPPVIYEQQNDSPSVTLEHHRVFASVQRRPPWVVPSSH